MPTLYELLNPPPAAPPTESQKAAAHLLAIAGNISGAIRDGVTAFGAECQRLGMTAILAELPPDAAQQITQALPVLQALWAACSPNPFPDMPADAPETVPADGAPA